MKKGFPPSQGGGELLLKYTFLNFLPNLNNFKNSLTFTVDTVEVYLIQQGRILE